jgi:Uncharacterized alpha/beta hydrolase domain (DUF2235)
MALYAFDGTWNEHEDSPVENTNVSRFCDLYTDSKHFYEAGVGNRFGVLGKIAGGLFGAGGRSRIHEMYDALAANFARGDKTIDIIGFSRGAALAVHFANIIGEAGIKTPDGNITKSPIRFLGVWDVVGAFGIPFDIGSVINFQDINVGWTIDRVPSCVQRCAHAMALDERRSTFNVTRLDRERRDARIQELWFRGAHSDVGGGNRNVVRNNIALAWMLEQAQLAGARIDLAKAETIAAAQDKLAPFRPSKLDPKLDPRRPVFATDQYHPTAISQRLGINESATFTVDSREKHNWSAVLLEQGGAYEFQVPATAAWTDGDIHCGPIGWTSDVAARGPSAKFLQSMEAHRRLPTANWFELVGSLGDDDDLLFAIGAGGPGRRYRATRTGELFAFANDYPSLYGNNVGSIPVTVKRIA